MLLRSAPTCDTLLEAMPNKTVYLRDNEVDVWERARELAGDKLSPIILRALESFVAEEGGRAKGFERLLLEFQDAENSFLPTRKAFIGRWIIDPDKPYVQYLDHEGLIYRCFWVAETAKGNVVVFSFTGDERDETEDRRKCTFQVFRSFDHAAAHHEVQAAIIEAVKRRGIPVEELDI